MRAQIVWAETIEERTDWPNEVRLTFSPWLFESLIWHNDVHFDYHGAGNDKTIFAENHKYSYTPHIGVEYFRRINRWFSAGIITDFQHTKWNKVLYNNQDVEIGRSKECFYNLSFIPSTQFTYFRHPNVNLYSSFGVGMDINGGTETDIHGKKTAVGVAINITAFGVRAGKGRWYGFTELGGLYALKDINTIYMVGARIVTIGVSAAF